MKKHIHIISLLLVSIALTHFFYHDVIYNSNQFFFRDAGDAIKNYFTYAYHIEHDSSYTHFEGMNYPYGEHFLYTDCHPALANAFKLFGSEFDFFKTHSIGMLNFIMILSIFLCFIVCYFLLLEFNIHKWISLLFSLGITLLAPQIFRMSGHFALSYSIAIPLSWLLLLRTFRYGRNALPLALLILNNCLWMFIHAYLGIIVISFLFVLTITHILSSSNKPVLQYKSLLTIASSVIPVIIFYVYLKLTDNHIDRTVNPSGFFLYTAELDDLFIPHHGILRTGLDKLTGNIIKLEWEAWCYVGFATTLVLLSFLVALIKRLITRTKQPRPSVFFTHQTLNHSLFAAFILLLFAMAFPFKQIPSLIDFFPVFKQFRGTGRFTWPFFFVALVFTARTLAILHEKYKLRNKTHLSFVLIIVTAALNVIEAWPYHTKMSESITKAPNYFNKKLVPEKYTRALDAIDPETYQAIISLPFYYVGSESYARPRTDPAMQSTIILSYHTGIPIVCASLTRTSVSESKNIVQLISPDYYEKAIAPDFPDTRPLLIVKSSSNLTKYESDILNKAQKIYSGDKLELYSLQLKDLFQNSSQKVFREFQKKKTALYPQSGFYLSDSSYFYINRFEERESAIRFNGRGAFKSEKRGKNILAEFNPGTFSESREYCVSVWMHNGEPDALNLWFRFIIEEFDEKNNLWHSTTYFPEHAETINGNWSLVEGVFRVNDSENRVYIVTKGKENSKASFHADDLLIREKGIDIYLHANEKDQLFFNNHRIDLDESQESQQE